MTPRQARGPKAYSDIDLTQAARELRNLSKFAWISVGQSLRKAASHSDITEDERKIIGSVNKAVTALGSSLSLQVAVAMAEILETLAHTIDVREDDYGFGYLRA